MLIAMAVYDTEENNRTWMTDRTLASLMKTVDLGKHRIVVSDNGSCYATQEVYEKYKGKVRVIQNGENIGTAAAINAAWKTRTPYEHAIKMDNDVVIHHHWGIDDYNGSLTRHLSWVDLMELVFEKRDDVGIVGLKRRDLEEWPLSKNEWYTSELLPLPHKPTEPWLIIEDCKHVMGTCTAYNKKLLDKIGYLVQPGLYGFDDSLASIRAHQVGFKTVFLHGVTVDHIDPGGGNFITWKERHAGKHMEEYQKLAREYVSGDRSVYYDGS